MKHAQNRTMARRSRGVAFLFTLLVIAVAIAASVTLSSSATMNYAMSISSAKISTARATAESGVAWAQSLLSKYTMPPADVLPAFMSTLYDYMYYATDLPVTLGEDSVTISGGSMEGGGEFTARFEVSDYTDTSPISVSEVRVLISGTYEGVTRWCELYYAVGNTRRILSYGVASSTRLMLRGDVTINGDIYSPWTSGLDDGKFVWRYDDARGTSRWWHEVAWPLDIGSTVASERTGEDITINGDIYTSMSRGEFNMDRVFPCYQDFGGSLSYLGWTTMSAMDAIRDSVNKSKIGYDEPNVLNLTWKDFKTAEYRPPGNQKLLPPTDKVTTNPFVADSTEQRVWAGYTYDVWIYENRNEETEGTNQILDTVFIPPGTNAHFKNCIFRGVTYVDSTPSALPSNDDHNNVVFENCTFEGPIVTDVPEYVQLNKDSIEFRGQTTFTFDAPTLAEGYTIIAPNFNVNFGSMDQADPDEHLTLYGLVLGGIVDIRQSATISGSVVSMATKEFISPGFETLYDPDAYWQHGMNIGNWEDSFEGLDGAVIDRSAPTRSISITPQPDNPYPSFGMYIKFAIAPLPRSYRELTGVE